MARVGWIGLGAMGGPMAAVLVKAGNSVKGFDISPTAAAAAQNLGVTRAERIVDAARDVDVLTIMVATPEQGESVLFGPDSAADALAPGTVVLVTSTVGPAAVTQWSERLAERGVEVVDAPVSGGVARAVAGDLLIMASGARTALETAQPLLDAMAREAVVVGKAPGDGQRVKLVNQLLCGVHIAVAGEALAFAEALGLDAGSTWEVLRHGAAASFMLDDRGARMLEDAPPVRSALDIFVKDLGLVLDAARSHAYPAPLASAAEQLYLAGRRAGLGRQDDSAIIDVLRGSAAVASEEGRSGT